MSLKRLLVNNADKKNMDIYPNSVTASGNLAVAGTTTQTGSTTMGTGAILDFGANVGDHIHLFDNGVDTYTIGVQANQMLLKQPAGSEYLIQLGGVNECVIDSNGVKIGNTRIDGNTISSVDVNGNIILNPNGSGEVILSNDTPLNLGTTLGNRIKLFDDGASVYSIGTAASLMNLDIPTGSAYQMRINSVSSLTVDGTGVIPKLSAAAGASNINIDASGYITDQAVSKREYKENITPLDQVLDVDKIYQLKPVKFKWREDMGGFDSIGLIMEDVQQVYPQDYITAHKNGEPYGVHYQSLPIVILSALQKLKKEFDAYKMAHP